MITLKFTKQPGTFERPSLAVRPAVRFMVLALGLFAIAGCKSNPATDSSANPTDTSTAVDPNADPAAANLAPTDNSTQVAGQQQEAQPTQQSQTYNNAAPVERRKAPRREGYEPSNSGSDSSGTNYDSGDYSNNSNYDAEAGYQATLTDEQAQQPPPPLPEYAQPPAPDPNYLWTPGYWSYASSGYYWVPGAWVQAPYTGALWTPGYWGYAGDRYRFHHGFWGPHVGFYGGVNYGFGYVGTGYQGGYWNGGNFFYNRFANNIDISLHPGFERNVYQHDVTDINRTVINNRVVNNTTINNTTINNRTVNNVSYNGGNGGVQAKPRPAELAVLREPRVAPMAAQVQVQHQAAANPQQFYAHNQGRPALVAAPRPLVADHVAPPAHTTAEIQRAPNGVPVRQATPAAINRPGAVRPEPAPAKAAETRPAQPAVQQNRPGVTQPGRPAEVNRPTQPATQPNRPGATQPNRPAEVNRPAQPASRPPAAAERPAPTAQHPQPAARPAPAERPTPQAQHSQPATRPAPAERPAPQARPEPQPRPAQQPHPQAQTRPEPQARPAAQPHPQSKPEQERPASRPEQRPQMAVKR